MKFWGLSILALSGLILSLTVKKKYADLLKADMSLKTIITDCVNIIRNYPLDVEDIFEKFTAEEYKPFDAFFSNVLEKMRMQNDTVDKLSSLSITENGITKHAQKTLDTLLSIFDETDTEVILGRLKLLLKETEVKTENDRKELTQKGELSAKLIVLADCVLMIIMI